MTERAGMTIGALVALAFFAAPAEAASRYLVATCPAGFNELLLGGD